MMSTILQSRTGSNYIVPIHKGMLRISTTISFHLSFNLKIIIRSEIAYIVSDHNPNNFRSLFLFVAFRSLRAMSPYAIYQLILVIFLNVTLILHKNINFF